MVTISGIGFSASLLVLLKKRMRSDKLSVLAINKKINAAWTEESTSLLGLLLLVEAQRWYVFQVSLPYFPMPNPRN